MWRRAAAERRTMEMNGKTVTKLSSSPAAIMVSKVLRFLPAAGKAGVLSARYASLARRLNLTFTRL